MYRWSSLALRDWLESRLVLKTLTRIAAAQEEQVRLLQRITEQLAPVVQTASQKDLLPIGSVYTRDSEQARILDFMDRTRQEVGRDPTEEEVANFLDGKAV